MLMIHKFIDGKTNPVVKGSSWTLMSFEELLSLRLSDHFALIVGDRRNVALYHAIEKCYFMRFVFIYIHYLCD